VVAPGYTPVFLYLAEHGTESRIRVGALLALKTRLEGSEKMRKGKHHYHSLAYTPELPDEEARAVILRCLGDPDDWVRKKAWGPVGPGFLQQSPPDPVMVDFVASSLMRLAKPKLKWESNYCAKSCYFISGPVPKLEAAMLACAESTTFPDTYGHFANALAYRTENFARRAEFVRIFQARLFDADPEIRLYSLRGLERALSRKEIRNGLQAIESLKGDTDRRVREQADLTKRRLQARLAGAKL